MINIWNNSPSKSWPWFFINDERMDLVCLSNMSLSSPPPRGYHQMYFFTSWSCQQHYLAENVQLFCSQSLIILSSIHFLSIPTKLLPLSDWRILTFPGLAIVLLRAWMKESVSVQFDTSIRTARLTKHVNMSPYLLRSDYFSQIRNDPNMSIPK